jgi:DNA-binding GntR family transcriptional regulator
MAEPKKELKSSQVYAALKEMIADYRFQPGVRVNVEKLVRELGVSRVPVWEAIRRLEQEGLLETIPNRGVFMVEMTLEKAFELFQVRAALERLAGRLAAGNPDKRTLEKMERTLSEQTEVVKRGDLIAYSRLDYEFHSFIYRLSGNSVLQEMLEAVKTRMQPISLQIMPILLNLYQDHKAILEALRAGSPDRVEKAFSSHYRRVLSQILCELEKMGERKRQARKFQKSLAHFHA